MLAGNRVLDEVLNASSHFVGVILVIIGTIFLSTEVAQSNTDWIEQHDGERYQGITITCAAAPRSCDTSGLRGARSQPRYAAMAQRSFDRHPPLQEPGV